MNHNFKNKSFLLAITSDRGFYECFKDNLEHLGLKTYVLRQLPFKYSRFVDKLKNFFQKNFLKNKNYKKQLIQNQPKNIQHQNSVLNSIQEPVDYSLTIRADIFKASIINEIIQKSTSAYAYQWDGLKRFPSIKKLIPLYKKFYVFDEDDLTAGSNTKLLTNFYFDCYNDIFKSTSKPKYDIYYIGSYDHRIFDVLEMCEALHQLGLKLNIIIPCSKKKQRKLKKYPFIKFPEKPLSYKENLHQIANTKAILEIGHSELHKGLSFRAFESLGYNKKLITTNATIKEYDFYNTANYHVYENNKNLISFLETPMKDIDNQIKIKYSFTNWLHSVIEKPIDIDY